MQITGIKNIGPGILRAISERNKLTAAAYNMQQAIKYFRYVSNKIPEAVQPAKEKALLLCSEFSALAYNNAYANPDDIRKATNFFKLYS